MDLWKFKSRFITRFLSSTGLALLLGCQTQEEIDFSTQVKPILNKKCISCHGGVKKNAGFSVLFEEEALGITESGIPAIIPGNAKASPLIQRLHETDPELRMPYKKNPLSKVEIKILTQWIDQGAKWGTHWAYIPPKKRALPQIQNSELQSFILNPIDHFVVAHLENRKLKPNPPAKKNILARRVAFDLTGLPPKKELFDDLISDRISYENYVDRLLSSSAYGEKWASWWLDLARYADTKGYEKDPGRSIWQYRDWVINALNSNMPFDDFTTAQIAGDLLPNPTPADIIATGFHRNTMNNDEGGTSDEEFRTAAVIDRVNTTFDVWQNTTLSCVQCHSHPYDPFKHKEYYQMMAFFNNTRDEDTPDDAPNYRSYKPEDQNKIHLLFSWIENQGSQNQLNVFKNFLDFYEPKYQLHNCEGFEKGSMADGKWLALWDGGSAYLKNVNTLGNNRLYFNYFTRQNGTKITIRNGSAKGEILSQFVVNKEKKAVKSVAFKSVDTIVDLYIEAENKHLEPQENTSYFSWFAFVPELPGKGKKGYDQMKRLLDYLVNAPVDRTPILVENPAYMKRETRFFERGDWLQPLDTVQPNVPKILNNWDLAWEKNRLGLAQWMLDEKNPLTSRTLVNRIWNQFFGRGIVSTLEDMGTQSEAPSHPALLDWLAVHFIQDQQWKIKDLIKSIVLSATYRQSSEIDPIKLGQDPENVYYARGPKLRLQAEEIRDQALAVSGLLSLKKGGPGVMPPQPDGIWEHPYLGNLWKISEGEDRYRRAIYTYFKRTSPYPSFITFDAGSREVCMIRRLPTNTPLQALVTLNDPVYMEAAYHLAKNELEKQEVNTAIQSMYEKATFSPIKKETLKILMELYQTAVKEYEQNPSVLESFLELSKTDKHHAALTVVANAIMNLDEFLTHA